MIHINSDWSIFVEQDYWVNVCDSSNRKVILTSSYSLFRVQKQTTTIMIIGIATLAFKLIREWNRDTIEERGERERRECGKDGGNRWVSILQSLSARKNKPNPTVRRITVNAQFRQANSFLTAVERKSGESIWRDLPEFVLVLLFLDWSSEWCFDM